MSEMIFGLQDPEAIAVNGTPSLVSRNGAGEIELDVSNPELVKVPKAFGPRPAAWPVWLGLALLAWKVFL